MVRLSAVIQFRITPSQQTHPAEENNMSIIKSNKNKTSLPYPILGLTILLLLLSSACQPVTALPPTATTEADTFVASEATISAQLTGIAESAGVPSVTPAASTLATPAFLTETLPPTSTPLPTDTPYPTDTPEQDATSLPETSIPLVAASPTFSADNPKATLGEPDWVDEFAAGAIEWPLYNDEHVSMQYEQGKLTMTALVANRKNPWDSWMVHPSTLTDFYVEVAATPGDCSGLDRYGLLARASSDTNQTYLFGLSCDGKYSLRYWNGQKISMLKEWTFHPAIHKGPGSENILGLLANGSQISIYANDTLLFKVEDETLTEGGIGLFVGAVMTDNFQVSFRRVALWELP
jgi:hypothetical protein